MIETAVSATLETAVTLRQRLRRWQALRNLLGRLERLSQIALAIDLSGQSRARSWRVAEAARFERRLALIETKIDRELVHLTCEGLAADLKQQQRKDRS